MNVLHVITSLGVGGAEKLVIDGLEFYQNEGIDIDLLVLQKSNSQLHKSVSASFKGRIFYLNANSAYNPLNIISIIKYLNRYSLVHIHLFPALYWVVLAKFFGRSKVKLVYTEHSTNNRRRDSRLFKWLDKWIYSRLDYVGCISIACANNLKKHLNKSDLNLEIIQNGINLSPFKEIDEDDNFLFFDTKSFVLIQISSFRKQKDQKTVIRSLALLPEEIKLVLVGDGPLRYECEELVNELNLNDRVKFMGNRFDIPFLLKKADLAIQSSNYEGFGLVAVEAMASGRAIVASDVDGLNEVVKNYGVLFPKGNFQNLSVEVLKFYENNQYKKEIELKCESRALDFSIDKMVQRYVALYKKIVCNE